MAARPTGSASISFGLVSLPVQLYSAAETQAAVHFNQINPKTGARVKQELVDAKTGEKIDRTQLVKGYEFSKGQYVTFTKDELKALEQKKTDSIDIQEFVPADQVDRLYYDSAYFLGPDKGGDKAYALLAEALKKSKLAAIGLWAARGKQYLVMLRPHEGGLLMETLHYSDELRSMKDVPLPDVDVKPAELNLAMQLIEQSKSANFEPEKYKDTVRERMMEQIQAKVAGEEITAEPAEEPETQIIDLMDALKKSLAKGGAKKSKAEEARSTMKAVRGKSTKKTMRKKSA
jgi:DNA end-binding protein Ku